MRLAIFCDFDDTIVRTNVTDGVLERFAEPRWLEIQENWLAGKLSAREVLEYQMPLVTVTQEDLDAYINSIEVDPFFAEFALSCTRNDDSLYILSDGFDYWIDRILRRALSAYDGAVKKIPVFACGLSVNVNRLNISFPYFPQGCMHGCATCKPTLFNELKDSAEKTIVIGDGVSDLLLARDADLVLAKDGLKEFCQREGIFSQEYNDFSDVARIISVFREKTFEDNIGEPQ
jgi:2,3-diketo-5-methylthio-1-phosphopentane phosphatase